MNSKAIIFNLIGALILCVGGIIGYLKSGSLTSLIVSSGFSSLITFIAYYAKAKKSISTDKAIRWLLVVWLGLGFVMAYRVATTGKFMPAGIVLAVSIVESAVNGYIVTKK